MEWRLPFPPRRQWATEMNNRRSFYVGILLGLMAVCCFALLAATAGTMFRHVPAGQRPRSCIIAFPSGDQLNVEVSASYTRALKGGDDEVEDLVGSKVWLKPRGLPETTGYISSVVKPVNLEDIQSSITMSTFRIDLPSGDVVETSGFNITGIAMSER